MRSSVRWKAVLLALLAVVVVVIPASSLSRGPTTTESPRGVGQASSGGLLAPVSRDSSSTGSPLRTLGASSTLGDSVAWRPEGGSSLASPATSLGFPPHPVAIPFGAPPPYNGHYYAGAAYTGVPSVATNLQVSITIPDDFPQGGYGNFYYVILSVWDNAGSYDQLGFTNVFGTWGIAYSTTSYCAGSYYYNPLAFPLQRGQTYTFEMEISYGVVHFAVLPATSKNVVWAFSAKTGGSVFLINEVYACGSAAYYDYTDYEEVYYTSGPRVPYEFFFSNNTANGSSVINWSAVTPASLAVDIYRSNITIANEPYYLSFPDRQDSLSIGSDWSEGNFQVNVSVGSLSPDNPVYVSEYSVPSGWTVNLRTVAGDPPFVSEAELSIPESAPPGVYPIGFIASDASGNGAYGRLGLTVFLGPEYVVAFPELGLPIYTPWSVALSDGIDSTTTGSSDLFLAPNGTYAYWVEDVAGYHQDTLPYIGNVTVAGADVSVSPLLFSRVTYPVSFSERGLPPGLSWQVTFDNTTSSLTTDGGVDSLTFTAANGTPLYSIAGIPGWGESTVPPSGMVVVLGAEVTEPTLTYYATFPVVFSERGLPARLDWGVTVNNSTFTLVTDGGTDSLTLAEPNGTLPYSVDPVAGWGQWTLPVTGSLVVQGIGVTEPTLVYQTPYPVVFSESGLPAGLVWQIAVNGEAGSVITNGLVDTLSFPEPNGTFTYTISDISGWHQSTLPYHGLGGVGGRGVNMARLVYHRVIYALVFSEAGLAAGLTWEVTVNGSSQSLLTDGRNDSLTFHEPNGTFPYVVAGIPGWEQSTIPYLGTITVAGAQLVVPTLAYGRTAYSVTMIESGLPGGVNWSISNYPNWPQISGQWTTWTPAPGTLDFEYPNGTFTLYAGMGGPNYVPLSTAVTFTVEGSPLMVVVPYVEIVRYAVTVTEHGLPEGTPWSIVITNGGAHASVAGQPIVLSEENGTYHFRATSTNTSYANSSGAFVVAGANLSVNVTYALIPTYNVTFVELGLIPRTAWSVTLDAMNRTSTTSSITFVVREGTFFFQVGGVAGYDASPSFGSVTANRTTTVAVVFSPYYLVTLTENGLPATLLAKDGWTAEVGGTVAHAMSRSIVFREVNGTYPALVTGPRGYVATGTGTLLVAGPTSIAVALGPGRTATLAFLKTGLARGQSWCVEVDGEVRCSAGGIAFLNLTPATYDYAVVSPLAGQQITVMVGSTTIPRVGELALSGAGLTVVTTFLYPFELMFYETGLAPGTNWCVDVGSAAACSSNSSMMFVEGNGTYVFRVGAVSGYIHEGASPARARVLGPATVTVRFAPRHRAVVLFAPSGFLSNVVPTWVALTRFPALPG